METLKMPKRVSLLRRYGFKHLLAWLFIYLVLAPFIDKTLPFAHELMDVFLTCALLSAIWTVDNKGPRQYLAIVLLVLSVAILWLGKLGVLPLTSAWFAGMLMLYLGVLVSSFFTHIIRIKRVNSDVICATLCLYVILGMFFGALYQLLEALQPGSFAGGLLENANPAAMKHYLNYYSFVTLSTLGYGDILPQTQGATGLCQAEAILGQFFTVVLVARLVGIQVAQESMTRD